MWLPSQTPGWLAVKVASFPQPFNVLPPTSFVGDKSCFVVVRALSKRNQILQRSNKCKKAWRCMLTCGFHNSITDFTFIRHGHLTVTHLSALTSGAYSVWPVTTTTTIDQVTLRLVRELPTTIDVDPHFFIVFSALFAAQTKKHESEWCFRVRNSTTARFNKSPNTQNPLSATHLDTRECRLQVCSLVVQTLPTLAQHFTHFCGYMAIYNNDFPPPRTVRWWEHENCWFRIYVDCDQNYYINLMGHFVLVDWSRFESWNGRARDERADDAAGSQGGVGRRGKCPPQRRNKAACDRSRRLTANGDGARRCALAGGSVVELAGVFAAAELFAHVRGIVDTQAHRENSNSKGIIIGWTKQISLY